MPEGPSIVILKEAVQQFKNKKVIAASGNSKKLDIELFEGQIITGFKSWGKHFLICFPKFTVRIHFMLFGSYRINEHTDRPARLHLQFNNGELNFYACSLKLIEQPLDEVYDWSADVMNPSFDHTKAIEKLQTQPDMLACDAILDQHIFSGAGNIFKNEVLFRIRIHPESRIGNLPNEKLQELVTETVNYAFDFLSWKKEFILKKHWLAHTKSICPRDQVKFHKAILGKTHRRSFYCDVCQILY
ncbi:DNA-formamidopyrimidine glycosylase family protein [Mucilaginibacter sp.]|uniref:DNA-formamidopyrimidine glycosylase family protein n=1 Tax=Mucilaginibacter sp. TaxID=1882438 RepID=UPI0026017735|nr:DNA-formamidopyrimidine glycosylase family protein [Mucilaginibacter sp.]MDB5031685.1 Formamidopyrimidine-DNA glycosylase catalytic domain protein [Mucilaginibacter sp.]